MPSSINIVMNESDVENLTLSGNKKVLILVPGILNRYDILYNIYVTYLKDDYHVIIIDNNTVSLFRDVITAIQGKLFNWYTKLLYNQPFENSGILLQKVLLKISSNTEDIILLAHSQGAIVATNTLKCISKSIRKNISLITIGGAAWTSTAGLKKEYHIINTEDIIPKLFGKSFVLFKHPNKKILRIKQKGHELSCYKYVFKSLSKLILEALPLKGDLNITSFFISENEDADK